MFDIGTVLKESLDVIKRNYVIAIPTVIASIVVSFLVIFTVGEPQTLEDIEASGATKSVMMVGLAAMVLQFISHGVTVVMAIEALKKGQTSLREGARAAIPMLYNIVTASSVLTITITLGFALLFFPGLIAMFLLMFTFPAIASTGMGALEALQGSYRVVRANLTDSLLVFAVLGGIILTVMLVSVMLGAVPVLGQFLNIVLNGAVGGFLGVVLARTYMIFQERQAPAAGQ